MLIDRELRTKSNNSIEPNLILKESRHSKQEQYRDTFFQAFWVLKGIL